MDKGDNDLPSTYYTVYFSSIPHWALETKGFGLQVVDPRTTVAAPTRFEVVPWLRELAFTVMKCKVFNYDVWQWSIE